MTRKSTHVLARKQLTAQGQIFKSDKEGDGQTVVISANSSVGP